jgi:hypothetical protein
MLDASVMTWRTTMSDAQSAPVFNAKSDSTARRKRAGFVRLHVLDKHCCAVAGDSLTAITPEVTLAAIRSQTITHWSFTPAMLASQSKSDHRQTLTCRLYLSHYPYHSTRPITFDITERADASTFSDFIVKALRV